MRCIHYPVARVARQIGGYAHVIAAGEFIKCRTLSAASGGLTGRTAKELAAALSAASIACDRGEIGPAERAKRFDAIIGRVVA